MFKMVEIGKLIAFQFWMDTDVSDGVHAAGTDPKIIRDRGWILIEGVKTVRLFEGNGWGPPEMFDKQELAAHRRLAIEHLLHSIPDGLQIVQVTSMLRNCEWMHAPVSKDLVKVDMQVMQELGKTKRVGNSKKWKVTT